MRIVCTAARTRFPLVLGLILSLLATSFFGCKRESKSLDLTESIEGTWATYRIPREWKVEHAPSSESSASFDATSPDFRELHLSSEAGGGFKIESGTRLRIETHFKEEGVSFEYLKRQYDLLMGGTDLAELKSGPVTGSWKGIQKEITASPNETRLITFVYNEDYHHLALLLFVESASLTVSEAIELSNLSINGIQPSSP